MTSGSKISDDMWLDPKFRPRKLKLFADAQIPRSVIEEIRNGRIPINFLRGSESRTPDSSVIKRAHGRGYVLLTLDQDFWDERKYPLHSLTGGIIYIAESPNRPNEILRAFRLVYICFARSYPLNWWAQVKIKATLSEFELQMRTYRGMVAAYRIKLRGDRVVAKELNV